MRAVPAFIALLLLAACNKESATPQGNEEVVIDKAEADVTAAEAAGTK